MNATLKVTLLKTVFILFYFLFVLTAINAWATGNKDRRTDCGDSPFTTEIINFDKVGSCYDVLIEISHLDNARFELSHANIDFGCGTISSEWNSKGWRMESNHLDPTTGIGGLKIDDIQNFGKDPNQTTFQVKFRYCPDDQCDDHENQFSPKVAYKAGECIYSEKPANHYIADENEEVNDESDDDENGDDDVADAGSADNSCSNNDTNGEGQTEGDSSSNENPDNSTTDPTTLNLSVEKIDPSCDTSDGSIKLNVSGGVEPYSAIWNTGDEGLMLINQAAGTYSYTLTDGSANALSGEVILESASDILIEANITNPDCQGINNGAIDLSISGGAAPYSINWSNGATTQNLTDLYAGYYAVNVSDANGCIQTNNISLYNTSTIQAEAQIVQPSCQEGTAGSINLAVSGGTEPYIIGWNTGDAGNSIESLSDNMYTAKITDLNGCTFSDTYAIQTDMGLTATSIITRPNCFDDPVGAIDLTVSGGTELYRIQWSNGAVSEDISGLKSGNYTATITDAKGCYTEYKTSVLQEKVNINYQGLTIPSCSGFDNGEIKISISSGTEPYDIQWSNGATTEDISNLTKGTYSVVVTDAEGCVSERSFMLPEPDPVQISYEVVANNCTNSQDIIINPSGGSLEYTFLWSNGNTTKDLINAAPGSYEVTVTDTRSCAASTTVSVADIPLANNVCLIADPTANISCSSTNNILSGEVAGALSYSWSVSSSDGLWEITSANDQANIEFTAGSTGSYAIISLNVAFEGGCELSCEKIIEVCVGSENSNEDPITDEDNPVPGDDNPPSDDNTCDTSGDEDTTSGNETDEDNGTGGEEVEDNETDGGIADSNSNDDNTPDEPQDDESSTDDDEESSSEDNDEPVTGNDWNKDKDCDECFYSEPINITKSTAGYIYEIVVNHEDCRYDLSHLTIEIPDCYDIIQYSNSMDWEMEITSKDPTTGLSGVKVDNIPSFGKGDNSSFTITLELTSVDSDCIQEMKCFAPTIAYKASTCVYEEVTNSTCYKGDENFAHKISTYPNPTCDYVKVDMRKCDKASSYVAKLIDFNGEIIKCYIIDKGYNDEFVVDLSSKKHGLYLLQMKSSKGLCTTHRIIKK